MTKCMNCGKEVLMYHRMTFRMSGLTAFVKCAYCNDWTIIPVEMLFQND